MNEGYSLQPFLTYYTQQMVFFMITIIIITFHHDPAWDKCGGKWMDGGIHLKVVILFNLEIKEKIQRGCVTIKARLIIEYLKY